MGKTISAGTVIVGSGACGATIARELAKKGESVVVLEKGRDHTWPIGTPMAYATMYDIMKSREGIIVRRGVTTGGSTMVYSGNAYDPPDFINHELGIDLSQEVAETKGELNIRPVPEAFMENYTGTQRLVNAAGELGYAMKPQERFVDYEKCVPECDSCLFGCRRGAKWTARNYLDDAVALGARLVTRCNVSKVLVSGNRAAGVVADTLSGRLMVECNRVVLAAGGIGSPKILRRSGIHEAGRRFFTDPMSVLVGVMKEGKGTFREMTFTVADASNGGEFVFGNTGAVNGFVAQIAALNFSFLRQGIHMKRLAGMFVKLCDDPVGSIDENGVFHKTFTPRDERTMARGIKIATDVMTRAGVDASTISVAKGIGGHPGGTCAMGSVVDNTLRTSVSNLYVCDNSVMPRSGGIPPVLTLIALGKKFARTFDNKRGFNGKEL
jgi:choline dehydrogenase-like flavoprotein